MQKLWPTFGFQTSSQVSCLHSGLALQTVQGVRLIQCPTNLPWSTYRDCKGCPARKLHLLASPLAFDSQFTGLESSSKVELAKDILTRARLLLLMHPKLIVCKDKYGTNVFDLPKPTFMQCPGAGMSRVQLLQSLGWPQVFGCLIRAGP